MSIFQIKKTIIFLSVVFSIFIMIITYAAAQPIFDTSVEQHERLHVDKNEAAANAIPSDFPFVTKGKLTIAVAPTEPPLTFYAQDARTPVGSEVDFASAFAESLGLELDLIPITWIDWSLGLTSRKYDAVLANVGVTEARKKKYDFSTYRQGLHGFYVKKDSPIQSIKEPKDLAGLRVIVGAGTNQERILLHWDEEIKKAGLAPIVLQYFDDSATSLMAMQSGRADVVVQPNAQLIYISLRDDNLRGVGTLSAGWPDRSDVSVVSRKDSGLAQPLTIAINAMIQDGSYQKILDRWHLSDEALEKSETNPPGLPEE